MSAGRKLVTHVHVNGVVYGPNDDVPADVAKQITNPKAWGEDVPADSVEARTADALDPFKPAVSPSEADGDSGTAPAPAKKAAAKKAPAKKAPAKKAPAKKAAAKK